MQIKEKRPLTTAPPPIPSRKPKSIFPAVIYPREKFYILSWKRTKRDFRNKAVLVERQTKREKKPIKLPILLQKEESYEIFIPKSNDPHCQ